MDMQFFEDPDFNLSIDLTPLVDVIFMLIIFFVTATTFVKPVIDVNLATAKSASQGSGSVEQLVIAINKTGEIYLDGHQVALTDLETVFLHKRDTKINLFVDRKAPFQSFISVIDLAKKHEREDIVVTTETTDN